MAARAAAWEADALRAHTSRVETRILLSRAVLMT